MVAACYVVYNEAELITESIRSVKAYVDRFVVVDAAFSTNPGATELHSTDDTEQIIRRLTEGVPLTYILPSRRPQEHEARNLYLAELQSAEWGLVIDGDEVLYADHGHMTHLLNSLTNVQDAVALHVYTTSVMFEGYANEMDPSTYETAPIISSRGRQPRLIRKRPGLRYQRDEIEQGIFTHVALWIAGLPVIGSPAEAAFIVNRHVTQPFEGYIADYEWETAQRDGAV